MVKVKAKVLSWLLLHPCLAHLRLSHHLLGLKQPGHRHPSYPLLGVSPPGRHHLSVPIPSYQARHVHSDCNQGHGHELGMVQMRGRTKFLFMARTCRDIVTVMATLRILILLDSQLMQLSMVRTQMKSRPGQSISLTAISSLRATLK